jgi:DNA-3-methyladenine glycosylase
MSDRQLFDAPSVEVAPLLLGAVLRHSTPDGTVAVRLTEVEAYLGAADPGSHAYRGPGKRNAVMYGESGHLYTYFTYGMHVCANVTCSPAGTASAVLLRGAEVIDGIELARARRPTSKSDADLARGPARLVVAPAPVRDRAANGSVRCGRFRRLPVAILAAGTAQRFAV